MNSLSWKKIEDENGFIYYFNKSTGVRQWDHPKFSEIKQRLDDCNYVKYSIYRVALKFRVLQNALYMDDVPLSVVSGVFEKHRLGANEGSLCLESCELEAVLSDIYFASNKKNHTNIDVDFAAELMLNFLYNVFDKDRKGKIQVMSSKLTLAILSNCDLQEVYRYIFQQFSDHNNCITRQRLHSFLLKIIEITKYLHEYASYGPKLINISVENCFLNSPGFVGINESTFILWAENQPKILNWIPILNRIKMAEPTLHSIKCTSCKTSPVLGLLYKCTKCRRYTQCQRCFFTGRITSSHKLSHSMREYCTVVGTSYSKNKLFNKLRKIIPCSRNGQTVVVDAKPMSNDQDCIVTTDKKEVCDIKPMSSPHAQLALIIKRLEMQNKELQQFLFTENLKEKKVMRYLEEHRIHINAQIDKLKTLKNCISSNNISPNLTFRKSTKKRIAESTPVIRNTYKIDRSETKSIDILSPIASGAETVENINDNYEGVHDTEDTSGDFIEDKSSAYGIDDISTWIGGPPNNGLKINMTTKSVSKTSPGELHNNLDEALAKLQQILANNFCLDESLGHIDNTNLKYAMSEVEGMLTSFIDTVENSRASSIRSKKKQDEIGVAV
ncbi:dystrophin-related protein 2-like isoform X1 [Diorhabda sublineata]|uniref:dystrophin-related protein 2-like isoform X1 n=2 Tax=Diorhabda sublineata TaxID=1163346 RepID=UPI0024E18EF9|nr:dystrophin-related protein 2-like isoform X1 [Diorhabda sublineata]